ncbi:hypothetical protein CJ205_05780 [Dolosicoccus paucivorans]|uniref:DAGKc domain-containing protein n=1 Tax=Dolosicoccus paucivorans TaxID=84521 RepID=A0A2N6SM56_9LACT|nr:diacylglycerol kinase family protein [Dolosicoccus paucivorans]PMC58152.1 hypothetical protein CJ205_05780 [Dolosicoccus paucivorans]
MKVHIIVNERAGGGRGRKVLREAHQILTSFQIGFITYSTEYPDHAGVIARQLISRLHPEDRVLVVGGDGTLYQIVTTFYKEKALIPVALLPAGNGNDFHEAFQPDKTSREIIETLLFTHQPTQLPVMRCYNQETGNLYVAMNNIGFGFNAQVNAKAYELKKSAIWNYPVMNRLRYLVALGLSLSKLETMEVEFVYDGQKKYYNDMLMTSIMNTPYFGGGVPLNIDLQSNERQLSLLLVRKLSPLQLIGFTKKLFSKKQAVDRDSLLKLQDPYLEVNIPQDVLCEMDGENLFVTPTTFHIRITQYPFYI